MDLKSIDLKKSDLILGKKYLLKERIGGGSFGQIFYGVNQENDARIAAKLEKRSPNATLVREAKVISDLRGQTGFPSLYDYGKEDNYNFIIVSLLGLNLEKLFKLCNYRFSLKTVLMIADQLITRIETLHSKNYVHRDIKPENFCIGKSSSSKHVFIIDFGLAKNFKDANGKHIPFKENKGLVGTARYASINAHLGREQSRRDDLEAIGYTLIYFLTGKLPWQNLKVDEKNQKYQKIAELKIKTPVEQLCYGLPSQFATYLTYVKGLEFIEDPDYKYLKKLFRTLFVENGYDYDYNYDWIEYFKAQSNYDSSVNLPVKPKGVTYRDEDFKEPTTAAEPKTGNKADTILASPPFRDGKKVSIVFHERGEGPNLHSNSQRGVSKPNNGNNTSDENVNEDKIKPLVVTRKSIKFQTLSKISQVGNTSREESPKKRRTIFQDSLAKNISVNNSMYSSKNINVSEGDSHEGKMHKSVGRKSRNFTHTRGGVLNEGSGEIYSNEWSEDIKGKVFQRGKTRTFANADAKDIKRSPFSTYSIADTKRLTSRKSMTHKHEMDSEEEEEDEGNINESSICEWNEGINLDHMINQKRFAVHNKKH